MKNDMKQISFLSVIALIVVGMFTLSCAKLQDNFTAFRNADGSITYNLAVSMSESTKALAESGANLNKYFVTGEQIAVVYTAGSIVKVATSDALTSSDIKRDGKYAKFSVTLDDTPDSGTPVKYIYPASMANLDGTVNYSALGTQNGTLDYIAENLDLGYYQVDSFSGSFPTNFTLSNPLAICKFRVTNPSGTDITASLTEMTIEDGTNTYTITITPSSLSAVYVAMHPVTSEQSISFTATTAAATYTKTVTGKTLLAGNLYPILLFKGAFTINSSGDKVYFSPGNLQAVFASANTSTCTWQFAANQWDFIGNAIANTKVDDNQVTAAGTVDLFGWVGASSSLAAYGINKNKNTGDYGNNASEALMEDWGTTMGSGWRTLTKDEWGYLFNTRTTPSGVRFAKATVNSVCGVILLPDDWSTSYYSLTSTNGGNYGSNTITSSNWTSKLEAHGAVFLPAAGERSSYNVSEAGNKGRYWSSTPYNASQAYYVTFTTTALTPQNYTDRFRGCSVRLVRDL